MMRPRKRRPTFQSTSDLEDPPSMPFTRPRRGSRYGPSSFVERWIRRGSQNEDEQPILNDDDTDNDFGVGIPIDGFQTITGAPMTAIDSLSLKSKPSTRRSSVNSSIDDVWHPHDDEEKFHQVSGVWPDVRLLDEFAAREIHEQASAEAVDLVRESVNEAADAAKDGRLRPTYVPWDRNNALKAQSTMRFTYFRDDMEATIHSPSIAGLLQPGQSFADLFPPEEPMQPASKFPSAEPDAQPATSANSASAVPPQTPVQPTQPGEQLQPGDQPAQPAQPAQPGAPSGVQSGAPSDTQPAPSGAQPGTQPAPSGAPSGAPSAAAAQVKAHAPAPIPSPVSMGYPMHKRPFPPVIYTPHSGLASAAASVAGSVPASDAGTAGPWWLDINSPTEDEMRAISKAFGVHPLTTEDIILHETREKVEIFHSYYFVCFTSFDVKAYEGNGNAETDAADTGKKRRGSVGQRSSSSGRRKRHSLRFRVERLKPLAVFSIVFKTGVITVHYRPTPHTINVRRRIRLLHDYVNVTSDWISYALIDDITDGYGPLISAVDEDVQGIEDAILQMHGSHSDSESDEDEDEKSERDSRSSGSSSTGYREWREKGNMLRWIGESRKRVMSLLSLLSNKADVIKGFAKRVSDQWNGAPRSEIAMYLSDIQDHLVTMTQSLNHYEKLLARSHSNYLAQINIDMTRTNNEMNDVLGKISVLGTIVLPMNIVTGLWGMNVLVPGQGVDDSLAWFWSITVMMLIFGISAYFLVMRFV